MEPGQLYHLYTHANGFEDLFRSDENYRYFLRQYQKYIPAVADTLAYCLMPNHIHFLIRIKPDLQGLVDLGGLNKKISQPFSNLFNSYTKAFNKMYSRMGSLFIPNFRRKQITSDQYLTRVIVYIHLNPVHHGFANAPGEWPFNSYTVLLGDDKTWINKEEVIQWFGNKEQFLKLHNRPISKEEFKKFES